MRLKNNLTQATALFTITLFLLPSIQVQPQEAEYHSIYVTVEIKPDFPQPDGIMMIKIKVEDVNGPIDDAVIKVLLTFVNGRQFPGWQAPLADGDEVTFLHFISGG